MAKTLTDRGPGSQESQFGADFMAVFRASLPDFEVAKGFLAQSKLIEPGETFTTADAKKLKQQCEKMLEHSPASFVFLYSQQSGIVVVPAGEVLAARDCNPHELTALSMGKFYEEHFECFIGDHSIKADVTLRSCINSFISHARSVTLVMQAESAAHPELTAWYRERMSVLSKLPIMRFFLEKRNHTIHQGVVKPTKHVSPVSNVKVNGVSLPGPGEMTVWSFEGGNTRTTVDRVVMKKPVEIVALSGLNIAAYDYEHHNRTDSFLPLIERLTAKSFWLLATPVYWYTMSAQMKLFVDRLSDLLTIRQDLGRSLRGKSVAVIASGTDSALPEGFEVPFRLTCNYLGMRYVGGFYQQFGKNDRPLLPSEVEAAAFGALWIA